MSLLKEHKKKLTQGFLELAFLLLIISTFFLLGFGCSLLIPYLKLSILYTSILQGTILLGFVGTGIYYVRALIKGSQESVVEE